MRDIRSLLTGDRHLKVLCLGAHADDIEIGAGGLILRLIASATPASFHWVVFSGAAVRSDEARRSAEAFLGGADDRTIELKSFRDGYFPYAGGEIKDVFEALKSVSPDLVLTHFRHDLHQDHRLINELTWNTFRDHVILEYEIPKYDGDTGQPNVFVPVSQQVAERKVDLIWEHFATQRGKHWFTKENLLAMMRVRGIECRAGDGMAEAFYGRKIVWQPE